MFTNWTHAKRHGSGDVCLRHPLFGCRRRVWTGVDCLQGRVKGAEWIPTDNTCAAHVTLSTPSSPCTLHQDLWSWTPSRIPDVSIHLITRSFNLTLAADMFLASNVLLCNFMLFYVYTCVCMLWASLIDSSWLKGMFRLEFYLNWIYWVLFFSWYKKEVE